MRGKCLALKIYKGGGGAWWGISLKISHLQNLKVSIIHII